MLGQAISWHPTKKLSGGTFCYQFLQSFFRLLYFRALFLKNGWPLDSLAIRRKLFLEKKRKDRLLLILQYLDGLYSYQWKVQLSGFCLQIDCQALWPNFQKPWNSSSFCSGFGIDKAIFDIFEASRLFWFTNDKCWQFVTVNVCRS